MLWWKRSTRDQCESQQGQHWKKGSRAGLVGGQRHEEARSWLGASWKCRKLESEFAIGVIITREGKG